MALLLTVELVSRIPMHRPLLAVIRVLATTVIAGIAAWVSYWHMRDVTFHYGESASSSYLLPVSVDGLIVVASVSLVEIAGRIRTLNDEKAAAQTAQAPTVAPVQFVQPVAAPMPAPVFQPPAVTPAPLPTRAAMVIEEPDVDLDEELESLEAETALSAGGSAHGPRSAPVSPAFGPVAEPVGVRGGAARAAVSAPARTMITESTTPRPRRPASETAQLADAIEAMQPGIREEELAARLNISVSRLRQVRREEAARRAALPH
jgi:hypothetical protein